MRVISWPGDDQRVQKAKIAGQPSATSLLRLRLVESVGYENLRANLRAPSLHSLFPYVFSFCLAFIWDSHKFSIDCVQIIPPPKSRF